jgi:hypothetical protein
MEKQYDVVFEVDRVNARIKKGRRIQKAHINWLQPTYYLKERNPVCKM